MSERKVFQSRWFAPVAIFVVCWSLTTHGKYSVTGDEPHYLIVTQSLIADGDFDVRNNYASGQSELFGAAGLQPETLARQTVHGQLLPIHDVGVSVALLPVYAVARQLSAVTPKDTLARFRMTPGLFTYSIVSLFVLGLTCLAAALTRSALVAAGTPAGFASGIVLAVWLSPPILTNSFLVFPEQFALLATAWAVRLALRTEAPSRAAFLSFVLAMGLLPWFHRKYALYAGALLCVVVWYQRGNLARLIRADRLVAAVLFVAPQICLAWWTWYHWGSLAGPMTLDGPPFAWHAFRVGSLGLFVDRENGLFVWAPIFLLLPAAGALAWRTHRLWVLPALYLFVVSAAHVAGVLHQWFGGFSPAARFLVPLIPIFTLIGAAALRRPIVRRAALALLVPQVLISAYCWQYPRAFWPQGDGHNKVLGAVLQWVGGSDGALPSLRAASPEFTGAFVFLAVVAVLNVVVYRLALGSRQHAGPQ